MLGALFINSNLITSLAKPAFAKVSPYSMPVASPAILWVFQRMLTCVISVSHDTEACAPSTPSMVPFQVQFSHHSKLSYSEYVTSPAAESKLSTSLCVVTS